MSFIITYFTKAHKLLTYAILTLAGSGGLSRPHASWELVFVEFGSA